MASFCSTSYYIPSLTLLTSKPTYLDVVVGAIPFCETNDINRTAEMLSPICHGCTSTSSLNNDQANGECLIFAFSVTSSFQFSQSKHKMYPPFPPCGLAT